jgi:hypothetical protein
LGEIEGKDFTIEWIKSDEQVEFRSRSFDEYLINDYSFWDLNIRGEKEGVKLRGKSQLPIDDSLRGEAKRKYGVDKKGDTRSGQRAVEGEKEDIREYRDEKLLWEGRLP